MADQRAPSVRIANPGALTRSEAGAEINEKLAFTKLAQVLPGLESLWAQTRGKPDVCIAVLDGPVDQSHPSLAGARLQVLPSLVSSEPMDSPATRHGTHVASIIFGQQSEPVSGIAPGCRGLVIPIFQSDGPNSFRPVSQLDLARAIGQAMAAGANIINVSGGEYSPSGEPYPLLNQIIADCARQGILIVAAAGNQGCDCLHVPAAAQSVLAVGAMNAQGEPLEFSNWGSKYQNQGILAPGAQIAGAVPGGGWAAASGTSYATAVVSGIAGLLLSLQKAQGRALDPNRVRENLLQTAIGCDLVPSTDCRRLLAGRLNIQGALSLITKRKQPMSEHVLPQSSHVFPNPTTGQTSPGQSTPAPDPVGPGSIAPSEVQPAACAACQATAASQPQLVYAVGQVGYDFNSEARLDSFAQKMADPGGNGAHPRVLALDPKKMIAHLRRSPSDATALEWTLKVDDVPLYAIRPVGPFAAQAYELLRTFLEQSQDGIERCSVPGVIAGNTRLLMGHEIPVIIPELRAMRSWNTAALVQKVAGRRPAARAQRIRHDHKVAGIHNFFHRVYHEHRNLGAMAEHRAMNHAATTAVELGPIFEDALNENMELHNVKTAKSPISRPGSDCWDVEIYFFRPQDPVAHVKKVYRYTVDVSDIVPVILGPVRWWYTT